VYRAQDQRLRRDVAVKVVAEWLAHDPATVRRFRREAELSARLAHRNVAAVLDAGSRPRDYIVMELVDGQDAATLLKQDQLLTITHAVDVLVQISDALEHAHGRGVIHGDIAPRNILIGRRDGSATLVDFGLAVDRFGAGHQGELMGTPGYVAPELVRGGGPSPHSDLYSLGVVAYRLLGGPPPFRRRGREDTAARPSATASLPPLAEVRPDVPGSVTAIVASAMAASPAARPASVAAFRDRLRETRIAAAELQAA
jgi:eukaryotic-like serine/threonine-protein kinase